VSGTGSSTHQDDHISASSSNMQPLRGVCASGYQLHVCSLAHGVRWHNGKQSIT
jgi:hypothetical protein